MKKMFTIFAAWAAGTALTFAADPTPPANGLIDGVSFNVVGQEFIEDGAYSVPSVDATVNITFKNYDVDKAEELGLTPMAMLATGSGFAIGIAYEPLVGNDGVNYTLTLNKEKWGDPYLGNFYVTVMVFFATEDMEFYEFDEEPVMYEVSYTTPNTVPAVLVSTYPDADNPWEYETFTRFYDAGGEVRFNFSNMVEFAENVSWGTVTIYLKDEFELPIDAPIEKSDGEVLGFGQATSEWNALDSYCTVTVCSANDGALADDIDRIEIALTGVKSFGQDVTVPALVLRNVAPAQRVAEKAPGTAGVIGIAADGNETVSVYNLQGVCVMENATKAAVSTLPAGIYIVNGKKIIKR